MKYYKYLFIFLLFIPFIVFAEECDISNITITSMEQANIKGNTKVLSEPTYYDRTIKLNLKMYDVGDSITYNLVIKNDSNEDYMIDEDTFKTNSDYIEYTLKTNDNSNVLKAKNSKNMSLTVTYKKEVENSLLNNRKYDASNTLKLSMNTSEKVKELKIITTDNIKKLEEPTKISNNINPLTSSTGIKLISIVLLTTIAIILLTIINKKKYNKYLIIILSFILIPIAYAVCKCDVTIENKIEIEQLPTLFDTVVGLAEGDNACANKYEGNVTDKVGVTEEATKVYFNNCEENRNVIFGGFCWQVIRTTETGGVKIMYNGEPIDGKCESAREKHKGIVQENYASSLSLPSQYLYGSSFTYDIDTNTFKLLDTELATWSDSTYQNLLGKFTCKTDSDTCNRNIWQINSYSSNTEAWASYYIIKNTDYMSVGESAFNANERTPAMVGYMFNKTDQNLTFYPERNTFKFGSTFTYDNETGLYTLSGTTQNVSYWPNNYNTINNTHYTCWNTTGECANVYYVYYTTGSYAYFFKLSGGAGNILDELLYNDDVNKYNSSVKGIVDAWYAQNMNNYTSKLEDTVFCNSRNTSDLVGWNPNGGSTLSYRLTFKNYSPSLDLTCENITDQFAMSNNKAKLLYPVALLQSEESIYITITTTSANGDYYWTISPVQFSQGPYLKYVNSSGRLADAPVDMLYDIRPVISLASFNTISSGTGSETDPWVID